MNTDTCSPEPYQDLEEVLSSIGHSLVAKEKQNDAVIFAKSNVFLDYIEHDNWDGGTSVWNLVIEMPYPNYIAYDDAERQELEEFINRVIEPFKPDIGHWVSSKIKPLPFKDAGWRENINNKQESNPENKLSKITKIPSPVIAVLSEELPHVTSHSSLNNSFMYADAPGEAPEGTKPDKIQKWLKRINEESKEPLKILGRLIEPHMDVSKDDEDQAVLFQNQHSKLIVKNRIYQVLERCNLLYMQDGLVTDSSSAPSKSLQQKIQGRDIPSIELEFYRAIKNISSEPREAVSASCNILEAIFKVYIEDEKLESPKKQDLQGLWKVVRADLGFDAQKIEDDDLKRIITGMLSIVDGIGAFRTHASSAHGQGRKAYKIKPRHARLAIHSAHTLALFILETWDERKKS